MNLRYVSVRNRVRALVRHLGYDVIRYPNDDLARRMRLLETHGVNVVFDIGANIGQYAQTLRGLGFAGRIVSFEPVADAYRQLTRTSSGDSQWTAVNVGLGEADDSREINVSANSQSSSLLNMLPQHVAAAPESRYLGRETITLRRLDSIANEHLRPGDR